MREVITDPREIPPGSHVLCFNADTAEAEDHAIRFIAGAPPEAPARYFVHDELTSARYNDRLAREDPARVGCVVALGHEQVTPVEGKLRPSREVVEFVSAHHDGVTAGGDTLSMYILPETLSTHLEYEAWFQDQPRDGSRFLCPYDLRRVPVESATEFLSELGRHHSHVVLSSSSEPAVRLLQLFAFGSRAEMPDRLRDDLQWATDQEYVEAAGANSPLRLAPRGREVIEEWSDRTTVDW